MDSQGGENHLVQSKVSALLECCGLSLEAAALGNSPWHRQVEAGKLVLLEVPGPWLVVAGCQKQSQPSQPSVALSHKGKGR